MTTRGPWPDAHWRAARALRAARPRRGVSLAAMLLVVVLLFDGLPAHAQPGPAGEHAAAPAGPAARRASEALLPAYRIVAYYGNPLSPILGRLGALPPDEMVAQLQQTVDLYEQADPARPVKPALELITPLAQRGPGVDGMYRARMTTDLIDEVAGWAADNDLLLILDVQVGRSSIADEVSALLPYLRSPTTHLALDPEFAMGPSQVPGQAIGSLDAAEVNTAMQLLADVVETEQLPPKVLIVHRFLPSMLPDPDAMQTDPRVQVVIDMDGFGSPDVKISKYNALIRDAAPDVFSGLKLFYLHDTPLLAPEDVLALDPAPDVVIYQ